jgi:hypothetical protein
MLSSPSAAVVLAAVLSIVAIAVLVGLFQLLVDCGYGRRVRRAPPNDLGGNAGGATTTTPKNGEIPDSAAWV